ncbi:MAG: hypothetical protein IKS83_08430 [Victivallales bacterium]|nr:hypothetical protein [Victivallales bacterium]
MNWTPPKFENHAYLGHRSQEITPFVWNGRLCLLENFARSADFPGQPADYRMHEDGCLIRDVESGMCLAYPWLNHYFSTVNVLNGQLVLVGGDYEWDRPWWHIRRFQMMTSDNLTTWSRPVTILEANERESLFNNAIAFDGERHVLLYETDDPALGPKFTFRFAVSTNLTHWEKLPAEYVYGCGKYVGAPGLYWEGGFFYLLYLAETFGKYGFWDTRIARSKDLKHWEDAPDGRSFLYPDTSHITNPELAPDVHEVNASDVELVEFDGRVRLWWNGGNQKGISDLQYAEFHGTRRQLFEAFFVSSS